MAASLVLIGFLWRVWQAQATFLNTDEAWHFAVANQNSLRAAYRASLTLAHPPLMVFILYFWKGLGTSNLMLRFPGVLAGTVFCWVFYKWMVRVVGHTNALVSLIFACFLPPMIVLSAELRQYSLMLMFAVAAAYFFDVAVAENSVTAMSLSCASLYLAMLSHYSSLLFAATLGIYAIARLWAQRPRMRVVASWAIGQAVGLGIAGALYSTHISKLSAVYPVALPLQRFGDFYLFDWYYHAGRDRLLPFLYRGTFGVFRFIFGQTGIGQVAAVLFLASVTSLLFLKGRKSEEISPRLVALLLATPFTLNWIAVVAGLYPYGRTRQCMFLAVFALPGVAVALARIVGNSMGPASGLAFLMVIGCHAFGTQQGRDLLPVTEQRHEHMDQMMQFVRSNLGPKDVIYTDQATSYQLRHYLCDQKPVRIEDSPGGFESFRCEGFYVVFTGPNDGSLTAQGVDVRWRNADGRLDLSLGGEHVWVVQGGWASGLGEALQHLPWFAQIEVHSFGRYLEIFRLPTRVRRPAQG
ncbi:MAG TPA: glycosyltransferase family 39 protein [Candidatus Sulfotelmatobacter sp.]|nr:glycosyltransferase family 39 protein [Candidatus Sulfotelmatobacter sp.]